VVLLLGAAAKRPLSRSRHEHGHRQQMRQEECVAGKQHAHERLERRGYEPHDDAEQRGCVKPNVMPQMKHEPQRSSRMGEQEPECAALALRHHGFEAPEVRSVTTMVAKIPSLAVPSRADDPRARVASYDWPVLTAELGSSGSVVLPNLYSG